MVSWHVDCKTKSPTYWSCAKPAGMSQITFVNFWSVVNSGQVSGTGWIEIIHLRICHKCMRTHTLNFASMSSPIATVRMVVHQIWNTKNIDEPEKKEKSRIWTREELHHIRIYLTFTKVRNGCAPSVCPNKTQIETNKNEIIYIFKPMHLQFYNITFLSTKSACNV